jgi:hypothetical protein
MCAFVGIWYSDISAQIDKTDLEVVSICARSQGPKTERRE